MDKLAQATSGMEESNLQLETISGTINITAIEIEVTKLKVEEIKWAQEIAKYLGI